MATTMAAMDMLRTMMPLVHESDLEMALGDLRGLCHKWNARREYRLELAAAVLFVRAITGPCWHSSCACT